MDHSAPKTPPRTAVSAKTPDWDRERPHRLWDPGRRLLGSLRAYACARNLLQRRLAVLRHRFWSVVTGADIPLNARIAGGLLLPHPNGIVIHPSAEIGPNCLIFQQVTIGAGKGGVPRIGGHVDIGAGARVLGGITVGDHALIGANAVVLSDVPAGATVVGIPARVVDSGTAS
jgi:serine O-acetyltransferase